jgi:hypothetical protein
MQSGNPKLVLWRALHGCGALHNTGPGTEGTRRHCRRLKEAGAARSAVRNHACQVCGKDLRRLVPSQLNAWTRASVGNEPRYYAESQAADMQAKVLHRPSDFA